MVLNYREAQLTDISAMSRVRLAVRENVLSDPTRITEADYVDYLTQRGKGWVATLADDVTVVGFAIVDVLDHNVWALFVQPEYAAQGVGKHLHQLMLDWYFAQTQQPIWLSTSPGTRAEEFYRRQGWVETGLTSGGEVRFEMHAKT